MKNYSLSALVAAGLLAGGLATSANAADLGGNCCADLEERIAELEATTARKGNRKVSLTVSGWVGQQISFWDDGIESNTYIHDLGTTLGSHVKFTGSAQISPGWSAGYVLQIEAISNDSLLTSQNRPDTNSFYNYLTTGDAAGAGGTQVLQSYWFVKSDSLGKVSLGKQSQASDNTAILVDGSGSLVPANWVAFDVNSFAVRTSDGNFVGAWGGAGGGCATMGGAWGDCNGLTQNVVRYDSPTFGGFSVSASWGEDDMWDVAARYAGEFSGFKLAAAAAYNEVNSSGNGRDLTASGGVDCALTNGVGCGGYNNLGTLEAQYFQAGAFLMHVPTGLFAYGAYGNMQNDNAASDSETWYGKVGLRSRFSALGHTVFYGEYMNADGSGGTGAVAEADGTLTGQTVSFDGVELWGGGIVQEVDAAAMSVWVKYRHLSADTTTTIGAPVGVEDFQYVGVGGLINF
jgi:hypothetical protein